MQDPADDETREADAARMGVASKRYAYLPENMRLKIRHYLPGEVTCPLEPGLVR